MGNFVPLFSKNLLTFTMSTVFELVKSFHKLIKTKCDGFRLHSTHPTISDNFTQRRRVRGDAQRSGKDRCQKSEGRGD